MGLGSPEHKFEIDKSGNVWFFVRSKKDTQRRTVLGNIYTDRKMLEEHVKHLPVVYHTNEDAMPKFKLIVHEMHIKRDLIPLLPSLIPELPPSLRNMILEYVWIL